MELGNRHFGKFIPNGEEIIIFGYRQKTNDMLVAFPSALNQQESQDLRRVVQTQESQGKDFLMDVVGGSVLQTAHHPSANVDWQTFLVRQAASGRSQAVRRVTMKDVEFYDASQKAYLSGYGPSIEPEVDALRKSRIQHQDAAMQGRPMPEPTPAELAPVAVAPAPVAPVNAELVSALAAIAQGQVAILEALQKQNKPAVKRTPVKRKAVGKKAVVKKADTFDTDMESVE